MKELLAAAKAMPEDDRTRYADLWVEIYEGPRVEAANRIGYGVNSGPMPQATDECRSIVLGMLVSGAPIEDARAVAVGYYEALTG